MPLLSLGPSCPLQTVLLSNLVWCDNPQPLVHFFSNLKHAKRPLLSASGCHARPSKLRFKKMCAKRPLPSAEGCLKKLSINKLLLQGLFAFKFISYCMSFLLVCAIQHDTTSTSIHPIRSLNLRVPTGCMVPPPPPVTAAKTDSNYHEQAKNSSLPTATGERYSQAETY